MSLETPPLLDLFLWLRDQAGLPLTIEQYHLLLEALQKGFGISSRTELKQICRLLWVKTPPLDHDNRFEDYFDRYFQQLDQQQQLDQPQREAIETTSSATTETKVTEKSHHQSQTSTSEIEFTPQVATAIRGELLPEQTQTDQTFSLRVKNLPVTERQLQQTWRYLRRPLPEGLTVEVDIEATVQQVSQTGIFLEPIFVPARVNHTELLLFVDVSNSMIPLRPLTKKLIASLQQGRLGKAEIYYFRNCPTDKLYLHPNQPQIQLLSDLIPQLHRNRTVALIVSDGGAARRGINRDRLDLTGEFLHQFKGNVRKMAWLNPLPKLRWQATTAEGIAQFVPMFELSVSGLKAAIRFIK